MHISNALSRLHNLTDTPDNKDVILLNFLQHFTPNYIDHSYSHWVNNLYVHKIKDYDTTQVKRKCNRLDRLDLTLLRSQLQTHALYDPNKCTKIPKVKFFQGFN